mmetsp:Transcript_29378/g.74511  ORF Transcript_29378/g.74511 Transcript_29378/m.74511 type:complete len:95 (+) Transcript_29378:115-399(+)
MALKKLREGALRDEAVGKVLDKWRDALRLADPFLEEQARQLAALRTAPPPATAATTAGGGAMPAHARAAAAGHATAAQAAKGGGPIAARLRQRQ